MTTIEALESTALILLRHNYSHNGNAITELQIGLAVTKCADLFDCYIHSGEQRQVRTNLVQRLIPAGGR